MSSVASVIAAKEVKGANDLFTWLDSLWNKQKIEGTAPVFMMHRFLASDVRFAPFADYLARVVRDPEMIVGVWRALLPYHPKGKPAGLQYVAAKKPPAAEELITRMMKAMAVRREVAEQLYQMVHKMGINYWAKLYEEFGVDIPIEK